MNPAQAQPGSYDTRDAQAMLDFQQKNVVIAQADITRATLEALARPPLENNFAALRRVLTERAAARRRLPRGRRPSAVRVGSSGVPDLPGADGGRQRARPGGQATDALLARLGIATPADAVAFFRRHPREDFRWLKVAVRLPAAARVLRPHMDLSAEIDRGDIWYDFPYDDKGERLPQPRERYPSLTLFVQWRGERVPLVRWRTTIGGWRAELASDGEEYFRYKDSDVGPRVWRHVVAAPVWIPPPRRRSARW